MQKKYSFGYDSIPVNMMKALIQISADPLVHIINCSLSNGIFSDQLKIAKVCPVFKSGKKNYYPIIDQYLSYQVF